MIAAIFTLTLSLTTLGALLYAPAVLYAPVVLAFEGKAPPAKPVPSQGTTSQEDKIIEAVIRAKLARSKIGKDGFTARVQGGVAYWEGSTSVVQHKGAATRMAKTAGAKRVVNNIKVTDDAKAKAAGNLDQGRRRAQVKRSEPRDDGQSQGPPNSSQ
jgi:hypothetical protein